MTPRRRRGGFALLAALWLVVAIGAVGLQFALEARDRRALGLAAADRGVGRAAAEGGLAIARARLERALREVRTAGSGSAALRAADPWSDADSLVRDTVRVGGVPVEITARDAGAALNVDSVPEAELRAFLAFVLRDYTTADALAQAIADWQDADDRRRPNGAERDEYAADGRLVLPANRPFRDAAELLDVAWMTPAIYARIRPFVTTRGSARVNLNAAPEPVLRSLPGMTDGLVARILAARAAHRRVTLADVALTLSPRQGGARGTEELVLVTALARRVTFETAEVEVTAVARRGGGAAPVALHAVVQRVGSQARVSWRDR